MNRAIFARPWALFRRLEIWALSAVAAASAAIWTFLVVAEEMSEGDTADVDRGVLLWFRDPADLSDPVGPRWLEEAVRDVTALGGFTVLTLLTVLAVATLLFYGKRRQALVTGAAVTLALIAAEGSKLLFERARPDLVPHGSVVYSHSFPSGHSTLSAATFFTLAAVLTSLQPKRRAKAFIVGVAMVIVAGVGVSRVYLGVHWPSDVLAGWALGAAWALVARVALGGLFRPGEREASG